MIIWGWKTTRKTIGHYKEELICKHCNNQSRWVLIKITSWFTLFFIPIIPYSIKKILICPICEHGIEVNGRNKEEIMQNVELY